MYRPAPILSNLFVILITCCNCSSQSLSSTQSFKGDVDHMLFNPPAHGYVSNLPATKWEESMIRELGTFGALVLGYPLKERIILSHEKLFMPENPPTPAPDLGGNLSTIRELVLSGKGDKASELSLQVGKDVGINGMIWTDPLIPACQIELEGWTRRLF